MKPQVIQVRIDEYGYGVMMHKNRVVEMGGEETAFYHG